MRFFTSIAIALTVAVPALAAPQEASNTVAVASSTISLTPQQTCLATCDPADVTCQAACLGTAHPNESQVNATTECAMKCDQGDGSPGATQKYSDCVQACIASHFPTSQTLAPAAGTGAASGNAASVTGSNTAATGTGPLATGAQQTSASGTGAAPSSSPTGAAAMNTVGASVAGLAGLFAAFFAL